MKNEALIHEKQQEMLKLVDESRVIRDEMDKYRPKFDASALPEWLVKKMDTNLKNIERVTGELGDLYMKEATRSHRICNLMEWFFIFPMTILSIVSVVIVTHNIPLPAPFDSMTKEISSVGAIFLSVWTAQHVFEESIRRHRGQKEMKNRRANGVEVVVK